jgi:hypothetical protein
MRARVMGIVMMTAILALLVSAAPASAYVRNITVTNHTEKCAWVTVYHFYSAGWRIFVAGLLDPGKHSTWDVRNQSMVRVRAEVAKDPGCTGPKLADSTQGHTQSDQSPHDIAAGIFAAGGSYTVQWTKL